MIHKEGTVMAFLGSFDISASGMSAQRVRMDIAAENIANMDTMSVMEIPPEVCNIGRNQTLYGSIRSSPVHL